MITKLNYPFFFLTTTTAVSWMHGNASNWRNVVYASLNSSNSGSCGLTEVEWRVPAKMAAMTDLQ
jgi:hypothetical protein